MDFFSSFFNIIIAILIVSAIVYSYVIPRVPKEGTPARKKYDEKMAKEEWERLNPPIYKTIEEISKPKPKPKAKTQQDYVEPVITKKMIDDFVLFLNKFQSKDEKKAFYTKIDLSEIDFKNLNMDFSLLIGAYMILHEFGRIQCDELELTEKGYQGEGYNIIKLINIEHSGNLNYEKEAEECVRLIHKPNIFDAIKSSQNDGIFYGDPLDWLDSYWAAYNDIDSYDEGIFFENGCELDLDKIADPDYCFEADRDHFSTGSVGDYEAGNFKITDIGISTIKILINDQPFNDQFEFKKSHQKYILILLMCVYRKDLAEQINQALKAKDS